MCTNAARKSRFCHMCSQVKTCVEGSAAVDQHMLLAGAAGPLCPVLNDDCKTMCHAMQRLSALWSLPC